MKLSVLVAVGYAALVSAKKTKTKTTRTLFTPTFLPKHFTKGWNGDDPAILTCGQCKDVCAVAPVPKWLDEWHACIKWKCSWGGHCKPTDWGVFPEVTATATANFTSSATSHNATSINASFKNATSINAPFKNATSTTPTFITVTSTTAPRPTSSLATISPTSSVTTTGSTAVASTTTSSSSYRLRPIRPSFITSMSKYE